MNNDLIQPLLHQNPSSQEVFKELDARFKQQEIYIRNLCGQEEVPSEKYTEVINAGIDAVIHQLRSEFKGKIPYDEEKLKTLAQQLRELVAYAMDLGIKIRHLLVAPFQIKSKYKKVFYILLIICMVMVFAASVPIIQPELPLWVSVPQAVVLGGSSIFLPYIYRHVTEKSKFLKWLSILGLGCAFVAILSCATAKGLFYCFAGSNTGGSFLSGGTPNWFDKLQPFLNIFTFASLMLTEAILAGRLSLEFHIANEAWQPIDRVQKELQKVNEEIAKIEAEINVLSPRIEARKAFEQIAAEWKKYKQATVSLECQTAQETLRDQAIKELSSRKTSEIIRLSKGYFPHKRGDDKDKSDEDEPKSESK